jgi:hypothetical protein
MPAPSGPAANQSLELSSPQLDAAVWKATAAKASKAHTPCCCEQSENPSRIADRSATHSILTGDYERDLGHHWFIERARGQQALKVRSGAGPLCRSRVEVGCGKKPRCSLLSPALAQRIRYRCRGAIRHSAKNLGPTAPCRAFEPAFRQAIRNASESSSQPAIGDKW